MMKKICLLILITVFSLSSYAQKKTNVIFILADDMDYGDLGIYGHTKIETANIDKLAAGACRN